jgi:hypothetical protein
MCFAYDATVPVGFHAVFPVFAGGDAIPKAVHQGVNRAAEKQQNDAFDSI